MRPDLRVIDGEGQVAEDLTAILSEEAALLEVIVRQRREIAALKGELTKLRRIDPDAEDIMTLLDYWQRECNHPRSSIEADGVRWRKTKERLANPLFTPERLKRAIDGTAAFPYEGKYGERFTLPADDRRRKDDLALHIFRDEVQTERRIALAEGDGPYRAYKRLVFDAVRDNPGLVEQFAALGMVDPHGEVLARAVVWARGEVEKRKGGAC